MSLVVPTAALRSAVGASSSWVPEAEHPVSTIATTSGVNNAKAQYRVCVQGLDFP
ncbi:Uncharacterised protein [Mycobacterium tuberculosis]|uniref:Uncharacterized protein n=1 Tax=Mycobacterium tuberculosis TaxID=1773 RepID=A0A0U0U6G9_MYCTX|nr:oligopeptide ABC transporter substrate-binding lipoprotein OppA [Mycobacterium tuberculosis variant bovis BCG]CKR44542.1 Uncharacterised protein [Mycobacterium tuberculosis]CKT37009.1 Uncharacterised protein [Mycobacterium tuberculosis]CNU79565.1 Uncharacterised protein [Mycobacterium tuberculosis]COV67146.1 Uncharacterised protein [Mycobacterium tuberculosis]